MPVYEQRLTRGSQSLPSTQTMWALKLYPDACEAGGWLSVPRRDASSGRARSVDRSSNVAKRRAQGAIRRHCAANRLNRLGTLTYAGSGCRNPLELRHDLAEFFRALRGQLGPLPYLWVPEEHPGGHGLHAHFAVGRFVKRSLLCGAWGRGFVHIKLIGDLPAGSGALEEARIAGFYLGKYAGKAMDGRLAGQHRYDVAQGFKPKAVYAYGRSMEQAIGDASEHMGRAPARVWESSSVEGWDGPPACWVGW